MSKLTRRDFFSVLTLKTIRTAQNVLATKNIAPPNLPVPDEQGVATCARCYTPFDPISDELVCANCRATEAKQQSLMAELLPK